MRLPILILVAIAFAANALPQTWHIDEETLPIPLNSLPRQQRANILRALEPRIEYHLDDGDPGDLDQVELARARQNLYVLILQERNGTITFVSGSTYLMCGAVGNCMTWVLDQDNKVILENSGKAITVLSSLHHANPDILFSVHDSASDTELEKWRFNGTKYALHSCGTSTMGYPGHYKKQPNTYSHPCWDETRTYPQAAPLQSTHP